MASGSLSSLRIYLGKGDGTFALSSSFSGSTLGLGSGDFNGDGRTDLVALNSSEPLKYQIYLGNGLGGFTAQAPVTAAFNSSKIFTSDLDRNGTADFVGVDSAGTIATYLGNGDGTFAAPILSNAGASIGDFALGRFNGDNLPDIVAIQGNALVLHKNLGGGQFDGPGVQFFTMSSSGLRLASTDFNSDGRDDVVATDVLNGASVAYSNGDGTFTADAKNPYPVTFFDNVLTTGDFNGDGHPDFVALSGGANGRVFLNDLPDRTTTALTATPANSILGTPVTLTATVAPQFQGHDMPTGTVTFSSDGTVLGTATLVNGVATLTTSNLPVGLYSVVATYSGSPAVIGPGGYVLPRKAALLASTSPPARVVIRNAEFAVGTDNGPVVCYRNGAGFHVKDFGDFSAPFLGVRPALGDFNGDGATDAIGGSGPGITAQVTIDDAVTLLPIFAVQPFDAFQGGVFVATADFNGDGIADFAVGADAGGEPRVCVYLSSGGTFVLAASFYAFDRAFAGGVRLAAGDINGDGTPDLIVGAGPGAGPAVAAFDGKSLVNGLARRLFPDFYAYDAGFRGGVFVAAGDVNRDGFADIVTGAGLGAPHVTVVSGQSLISGGQQTLASFYAADRNNQGGIRVAAEQLDTDGYCDIIAGAGVGNGSTVWGFSGLSLISAPSDQPSPFFAQDVFPGLYAGVYVG